MNKLIDSISKKKCKSIPRSQEEKLILNRKDLWKYKGSDSSTPWEHGLLKVHKQEHPLREISNAVDSPGHDLMKKVSQILQPLAGNTRTFVKDGYHFASILKSGKFKKKKVFMVSFDVRALFPSLPMKKALDILKKKIKNFKDLSLYTNLSADEIFELVLECTRDPFFECEFGLYRQKDGAPIGGPRSCLLCDLFMEHYENQIQFKLGSKVIKNNWLRYRDDTWMIWEYSHDDLIAFISYLNSIDQNIFWTHEMETNHVLNFLDVLVKMEDDGQFVTSVFRKPSHSDRYLHFSSDHPLCNKISVIQTLKFRAFAYCSNELLLKAELNHLKQTFLENGYPSWMIDKYLFKNNKPPVNKPNLPDDINPELSLWIGDHEVEEDEYIGALVVPYVKEIDKKLKSLCKSLDLRLLYHR